MSGSLVQFLAMLGTLALAYGLDLVVMSTRPSVAGTTSPNTYMWALAGARVVLAGAILLLTYTTYPMPRQTRALSLSFLVIGLLLLVTQIPPFLGLYDVLPQWLFPIYRLRTDSAFTFAATYVAVLGLFGLWRSSGRHVQPA
jgi:hypothetical protein